MKHLLTAAAFAVATLGGVFGAKAEDYPPMTLSMAHFLPQNYSGVEWEQWWADEITKRSNGAIKVQIFWSGSLGGAGEMLDLVGSGAIPLGVTSQGYYSSALPVASTAGILMMRTHAGPKEAIDSWRQFLKDPEVERELEAAGVVSLTAQAGNPYRLTCKRPVRTLADLKGLRFRVPGTYMPDWWASLGAVPVNFPAAEQYEAIQKGTVDCAYSAHDQLFAINLHEVTKYAIDLNTGSHVSWSILMNRDTYAGLPDNVKQLLQEVSAEMTDKAAEATEQLGAAAAKTGLAEHGLELVHFEESDKVDAAAINTIDLWVQSLTQRGLGDAAKRLEPVFRAKYESFHE